MPGVNKPSPPAVYDPADPLGTNPGIIAGFLAGPGVPTDDVDGVAGAYSTTSGGTTDPTWGVDQEGRVGLDYVLATDKELRFTGKGATNSTSAGGFTTYCVIRRASSAPHSIPVACNPGNFGIFIHSDGRLFGMLGNEARVSSPVVSLTTGDVYALVATFEANAHITIHAKNLITGVESTPTAFAPTGASLADSLSSTPTDFVVSLRVPAAGADAFKGLVEMAGSANEVWDSTKISAFFGDPWSAVGGVYIPPLVSGALTLSTVGASSLGFSLTTPTGGVEPYGPLNVYRSTAAGFTPGPGNLAETIASPGFPRAIALAGIAPNSIQYVVASVGDSRTPTAQLATSNQAAGVVPTVPPGSAGGGRQRRRLSRSNR